MLGLSFMMESEFCRGVIGLTNLGNTSFQNSVCQCLLATIPIVNFILSGRYENEINISNPLSSGGVIAKEFAKLAQYAWVNSSESDFYNPKIMLDFKVPQNRMYFSTTLMWNCSNNWEALNSLHPLKLFFC